jgi:hypothetical protein
MKTRTWLIGTRKTVKVLTNELCRYGRVIATVEVSVNMQPEGFVLMFKPTDHRDVKREQLLEIEFQEGGPMGAFWNIVEKEERS